MSMFAKFSLRDYIEYLNTDMSMGLVSVRLSDGTDLMAEADCPCVSIEQLPDIATVSSDSGFDIFIVRLFHARILNDIDIEILFNKLTGEFKKGGAWNEYEHADIKARDHFIYQDGSENKSGIQSSGNKLFYKQFMVYSPKTNIRR